MISVEEARERILAALPTLPAESVSLAQALGRVAARDVVSRLTQPPADVSAMDGYAVIAADLAQVPATLTVIGEAPAGNAFPDRVGPGQAVRIFTGGPLPEGSNTIVIQENVERDDDRITVNEAVPAGTNGGMSPTGTLAAFYGALLISVVSTILGAINGDRTPVELFFPFVILIGWLGCQIDSILGAMLENRGYLGKHGVNFIATLSGSLMALFVATRLF